MHTQDADTGYIHMTHNGHRHRTQTQDMDTADFWGVELRSIIVSKPGTHESDTGHKHRTQAQGIDTGHSHRTRTLNR